LVREAIAAANRKTAAANIKANPKITATEKKAMESSTKIILLRKEK